MVGASSKLSEELSELGMSTRSEYDLAPVLCVALLPRKERGEHGQGLPCPSGRLEERILPPPNGGQRTRHHSHLRRVRLPREAQTLAHQQIPNFPLAPRPSREGLTHPNE